jgi:hypothetical protein
MRRNKDRNVTKRKYEPRLYSILNGIIRDMNFFLLNGKQEPGEN